MRILFISRWFPFPPDNGSRIRVYHLLKQLSQRHEITLLSFCEGVVSRARLAEAARYCTSVQTVHYRGFQPDTLRSLVGYLVPRPRSLVDTFSGEMRGLVQREIEATDFDIVLGSQIESVPYIEGLSQIPRIFEEVELAVLRDRFHRETNPWRRMRSGLMWYKLERYVRKVLQDIDGCTVVSEQERELVAEVAPREKSVVVVPNGVDLERNTGDFGRPVPNTLIYSGALSYNANFDAMDFFLGDVFPTIRDHCPEARLRITGGYAGVPVERLALGDGAELTGYLDDIRPAVAQSWICVVPLRVGGGTRLKILEAMALGTPVVSTGKGAEGLDVEHEQNILIADEPQDFALCVLDLLRNKELRNRLSRNGRQLVERLYSWDRCVQPLDQLLCQVRGVNG